MPIINSIKVNQTDAKINHCTDEGCKLKLDGLREHVILKGEKICRDHKICDCIIFVEYDSIIIGIIELKSRNVHSSEIEEKLINSTKSALSILKKCNIDNRKFELFHIVLSTRWDKSELKIIRSKKIRVKGRGYNIITKKCGASFSEIISAFR